jgi:hypothetical protein
MNYVDEIRSVISSKLNNDIAGLIMKKVKTPFQAFFEEVCEINSTLIELVKDSEKFNSREEALEKFHDTNNNIVVAFMTMSCRYSFFYLYYIDFLKKNILDKNIDCTKELFVIKNNKIFLRKGEMMFIYQVEIVNFTSPVAVYTSGRGYWFLLEKGDVLLGLLSFEANYIVALDDATITFDYYIFPRNNYIDDEKGFDKMYLSKNYGFYHFIGRNKDKMLSKEEIKKFGLNEYNYVTTFPKRDYSLQDYLKNYFEELPDERIVK